MTQKMWHQKRTISFICITLKASTRAPEQLENYNQNFLGEDKNLMRALKIVQIHEVSVKTTCFDEYVRRFLVLNSHCILGNTFTTEKMAVL